jgi:2-oxoglutarate ferredoxin oxidoreductase subunit beta
MSANLVAKDYKSDVKPIWCPRCGDSGFLSALFKTFEDRQIKPHETVVVSGIGCAGRTPAFIKTYGFHVAHGRLLLIAMGIKLANPALKVIGITGDGDAFAIGMGHFPHAIRRNVDMLYVVLDNSVYGLTKGQSSPTTHTDHKTATNPFGLDEMPVDPVAIAIAAGAGFVARNFAGNMKEMRQILPRAFEYKGFAFIHALCPCSTFYDTFELYQKQTRPLPEDYRPDNRIKALEYGNSREPLYTDIFINERRATMDEKYDTLHARVERNDGIRELAVQRGQ